MCLAALALAGCSGTRHLGQDELLIQRSVRFKGVRQLDSDIVASAIRTKPNRRIILPKAYLHIWALGTTLQTDSAAVLRTLRQWVGNTQFWAETVRFCTETAGEPPALVDPQQLDADAKNLESVYFGQGFLHAPARQPL
jgi:hypothetical protein